MVISVLENTEELSAKWTWLDHGYSSPRISKQFEKQETYLSCYVCDRCQSNSCHAMNSGVTWSCCFIHIVDWAWRCKNMFEALDITSQEGRTFILEAASPVSLSCFYIDLSMDPLGQKVVLNGHWSLGMRSSPLCHFIFNLIALEVSVLDPRPHISYWLLIQPVHSSRA